MVTAGDTGQGRERFVASAAKRQRLSQTLVAEAISNLKSKWHEELFRLLSMVRVVSAAGAAVIAFYVGNAIAPQLGFQ